MRVSRYEHENLELSINARGSRPAHRGALASHTLRATTYVTLSSKHRHPKEA
jgi:hypothetical protein